MKRLLLILLASTFFLRVSAQTEVFNQKFYQAVEYFNSGNYAEAENLFTDLLKDIERIEGKSNFYAETLYFLANVHRGQNKIEQALDTFAEAYDIFEKDNAIHLNYLYLISRLSGDCLYSIERYEEALDSYEMAMIYLNHPQYDIPNSSDDQMHWCKNEEFCFIYTTATNLALQLGKLDKAEEFSSKALSKYSTRSSDCLGNELLTYQIYDLGVNVQFNKWKFFTHSNDFSNASRAFNIIFDLIKQSGLYSLMLIISSSYSDLEQYVRLQSRTDTSGVVNTFDNYLDSIIKGFEEIYELGYISSMEELISMKTNEIIKAARICSELGLIKTADNYYKTCVNLFEMSEFELKDNSYSNVKKEYADFKLTYEHQLH